MRKFKNLAALAATLLAVFFSYSLGVKSSNNLFADRLDTLNTRIGMYVEAIDGRPSANRNVKPVNRKVMTKEQLVYIERFAPVAQQEQDKYGIPASIKLAQGLIESRSGQSKLSQQNNNHFGMKCFAKNCKKGHCSNFSDDSHKDFFKKYPTAWASWRDHSELLKNHSRDNYDVCFECEDYKCWAYCLKKRGYATAPNYAELLIKVIEDYELYRFDKK